MAVGGGCDDSRQRAPGVRAASKSQSGPEFQSRRISWCCPIVRGRACLADRPAFVCGTAGVRSDAIVSRSHAVVPAIHAIVPRLPKSVVVRSLRDASRDRRPAVRDRSVRSTRHRTSRKRRLSGCLPGTTRTPIPIPTRTRLGMRTRLRIGTWLRTRTRPRTRIRFHPHPRIRTHPLRLRLPASDRPSSRVLWRRLPHPGRFRISEDSALTSRRAMLRCRLTGARSAS